MYALSHKVQNPENKSISRGQQKKITWKQAAKRSTVTRMLTWPQNWLRRSVGVRNRKNCDLSGPARWFLTVLWSIRINTYIKHRKLFPALLWLIKTQLFHGIMLRYRVTPMWSFIISCSVWPLSFYMHIVWLPSWGQLGNAIWNLEKVFQFRFLVLMPFWF